MNLKGKGPFDVVVSVGQSCQVAYQLKRRGLRTKSGPFDWFTVRMDALLTLLKNDFCDFMLLENLAVEQNLAGKLIVRDTGSTVKSLHDFQGPPDDATPMILGYDDFRSKIDRRIAAFKNDVANAPSMLFVRYGGTREESHELLSLLESMRPSKQTALLVVADTDEMEEDWRRDNLYNIRISFPKGVWKGNNKEWDKALGSVRLTHPTLRQFKDRLDCHPLIEKMRKYRSRLKIENAISGENEPQ